MNTYRRCFAVSAGVISVPCLFLILVNARQGSWPVVAAISAVTVLLWGLYWLLRKDWRYAFAASFAVSIVLWLPLMYQTGRRVAFVLENGGMERRDGAGSPAAFLLGMVMEQSFFIPLSAVLLVGTWRLYKDRGQRQVSAGLRPNDA